LARALAQAPGGLTFNAPSGSHRRFDLDESFVQAGFDFLWLSQRQRSAPAVKAQEHQRAVAADARICGVVCARRLGTKLAGHPRISVDNLAQPRNWVRC